MVGVAVSSVTSAALTLGVLVVAGRVLGPGDYAHFMVLWGAFFAATGLLAGLQQEVTRSVATARALGTHEPTPLLGSLVVGMVGAVLLAGSAVVWGERVLGPRWPELSLVVAAGFAGYSLANFVTGALAGTGAWPAYSLSIVAEGVLRAAVVTAVVSTNASEVSWAVALLSGLLGWVVVLVVSRTARATPRQPAADPVLRFSRRATQAVVAAGCSALALSGFPVLLRATDDARLTAATGVTLAVVVCTRAPMLLLLSFQGPLIRRFVDERERPLRHLVRPTVIAAGGFVGAALAAYVVGPVVMRVVFGDDFDAAGWFVAVAVLGAGLMAAVTVTGWLALARGRHAAFAAGWLVVTAATALVLTLPLEVEPRTALALLLGPVAGGVVHLTALRTTRGATAPEDSGRTELPLA
jgi:O-antigen/teichoic acid export membrane protein